MEDVKWPSEACIMCTNDGNTFYLFTKNTWIGDLGVSFHITNNNTSMYDVTNIDGLIQCSSGIMHATKKGKLQVTVHQVNGEEQVHTLWPVKFCPLASENYFPSHANSRGKTRFVAMSTTTFP